MSRERNAHIWVDPGRMGGKPCIAGTRLPADHPAKFLWDLGTEKALAELREWDYVTDRQWLVACWYVATYGTGEWAKWRRRWGSWAEEAGRVLWTSDGPLPPWPPERSEAPA